MRSPLVLCVALAFSLTVTSLSAQEPIPFLYNTGVDDFGTPLFDNDEDFHYELIAPSNIEGIPIVATSEGGFPIGPWLPDSIISAWITPSFDTNGPGNDDTTVPSYIYRTTFDLTGKDVTNVVIDGRWSSDNGGLDIVFNGQSTSQAGGQFTSWSDFTLSTFDGDQFVAGLNTIDFLLNNAGNASGPTGLRVEMTGEIGGEIKVPDRKVVDTLFNTGVDENHDKLTPGDLDPNWDILVSADFNFDAPNPAIVQEKHPAWASAGRSTGWVSTVEQGTTNIEAGTYVLETSFDLTGFDPAEFDIEGSFLADNSISDVLLNGFSTGIAGGGFTVPTEFFLDQDFVDGVNTLTFVFENAGDAPNPGGLAVTMLGTVPNDTPSERVVIDSLFSTGVDESHDKLPTGDLDPHWDILVSADFNFDAPNPAIVQEKHPAWASAGRDANWISIVEIGTENIEAGTYVFETTFDLTGIDLETTEIEGEFLSDNSISDILINGNSTGIFGGGFTVATSFLIDSDFVDGLNTLTFIMENAGDAPNPGGLAITLEATFLRTDSLLGDLNGDGVVDGIDFRLMVDNFGRTDSPTAAFGNLDGDSAVGVADVAILQSQFGKTANNPAAVPEPSAIVLLLLGMAGLFSVVISKTILQRGAIREKGSR